MSRPIFLLLGIGVALCHAGVGRADSIWERRDPVAAYLFNDYRARKLGDVLTIVVNENTGFDAQESRAYDKETNTNTGLSASGSASAGGSLSRKFSSIFNAGATSQRKFDGKANSTIDRKFTDKMSVVVVGVQPNGNLLVEGYRQRVVNREVRTLWVTGIIRPADIGPFNTVQSSFIANFNVNYLGRGPESSYTTHGWGGRIMNVLWPY